MSSHAQLDGPSRQPGDQGPETIPGGESSTKKLVGGVEGFEAQTAALAPGGAVDASRDLERPPEAPDRATPEPGGGEQTPEAEAEQRAAKIEPPERPGDEVAKAVNAGLETSAAQVTEPPMREDARGVDIDLAAGGLAPVGTEPLALDFAAAFAGIQASLAKNPMRTSDPEAWIDQLFARHSSELASPGGSVAPKSGGGGATATTAEDQPAQAAQADAVDERVARASLADAHGKVAQSVASSESLASAGSPRLSAVALLIQAIKPQLVRYMAQGARVFMETMEQFQPLLEGVFGPLGSAILRFFRGLFGQEQDIGELETSDAKAKLNARHDQNEVSGLGQIDASVGASVADAAATYQAKIGAERARAQSKAREARAIVSEVAATPIRREDGTLVQLDPSATRDVDAVVGDLEQMSGAVDTNSALIDGAGADIADGPSARSARRSRAPGRAARAPSTRTVKRWQAKPTRPCGRRRAATKAELGSDLTRRCAGPGARALRDRGWRRAACRRARARGSSCSTRAARGRAR